MSKLYPFPSAAGASRERTLTQADLQAIRDIVLMRDSVPADAGVQMPAAYFNDTQKLWALHSKVASATSELRHFLDELKAKGVWPSGSDL